jgi:hypothetical protein
MTDVRDTNPDATARRRARFQIGWQHAVEDREYGEDTMSRLTWQNLGWRLGRIFGATPDSLIEEMYVWCVAQQAEVGRVLPDD